MTTGSKIIGSSTSDLQYRKDWNGTNDPNKVIPQPYTSVMYRTTRGRANEYNKVSGAFLGSDYLYAGTQKAPAAWTANDELSLLAKLSDGMRGHGFNAGVFAAELPESLATIRNTAVATYRIMQGVLNRNLSQIARALASTPGQRLPKGIGSKLKGGDFSGAWLALQYGWLPLLSDCYEAARFVESRTGGPRSVVFRAHHRVKSEWAASASPSNYSRVPAWGVRKRKYIVTLKEPIGTLRTLGLTNPVSVIWEKIPFSFVLDWFIPIGSYLDSVSFFSGLSLSYVRTDWYMSREKFMGLAPTDGYATGVSGWVARGGFYENTCVGLTRTLGTQLSVPTPDFKTLEQAFSIGHIKNAAALIHQLFGSRK